MIEERTGKQSQISRESKMQFWFAWELQGATTSVAFSAPLGHLPLAVREQLRDGSGWQQSRPDGREWV